MGYTRGWLQHLQRPQLSANNEHSIKSFNTWTIAVGARQYLRSSSARIRAFGDVAVGYERLTADMFYFNVVRTDTMVYTGGPLARVRLGSQWRLRDRLSSELALQWQLASYGDWIRDGKSIPGAPAKLANYSVRSGLRVRM